MDSQAAQSERSFPSLTCLIFAGLLLVAPSLLGFKRSNAAWICYGLSSISAIGAFINGWGRLRVPADD